MGTGSSLLSRKKIFLQVADKEISVVFSPQCTVEEFKDLLASAAGLSRWSTFQLVDHEGSLVSLCPSIPTNTISTPYKLQHVANGSLDVDAPVISEVLTKASEVVVKAFKIQEFTQEFGTRLDKLEKKFEDGSSITTHHLSCKPSQDNDQPPTDSFIVNQKEMDSIMEKILSKETIEILKKPTFDIWHWEQNEMAILIEHMYHELGLIQSLNINLITFRKWLVAVQYNYRNNPFHNFRHCFCVTQMMYGMIHLLKLTDYLTKLELASLMTSCVCHDIDHPGYNNSYQINARTELAIRYNDISPLENHHCAITFQLLENDEYNIFANLKKEDFKQLRIWIIELILATDMARHSEYMELFKKIQSSFDFTNEEHKKIVMTNPLISYINEHSAAL
jgi:high affinity cGMP-specific 3',5'-cyclic phosphodiesterase 9